MTTTPALPPEPAISLRFAGASDIVLLAELGARTFADSFADQNTPEDMAAYLASSFSPEIQAAELADPAARFLILERDGRPAGYAHLRFGPAPAVVGGRLTAGWREPQSGSPARAEGSGGHAMEINRIYVDRAFHGQGLGARLMQACLDQARQAGCDRVWLGVWERNRRAIAFYHKWGFEQVGTQSFMLGSDRQTDWIMARDV
jgi:diamine N-acetyltransferase